MPGPRHHAPTSRCNTQVCHLTVTVSADCRAAVDSERVFVERGNPDVRIIWTIRGQGEFAANGIAIHNAGTHFGAPQGGGTKIFKWDLRNTQPGNHWKYDVNVTLNGRACPALDPFIMN